MRFDIPLDQDSVAPFLPWLVGFMVFLAILALAGLAMLNGAAGQWNRGVSDTLTVQVEPAPDGDAARDAENLQAVLDLLRKDPGVAAAEPMARSAVVALLEPWLGSGAAVDTLPLPQLVDVTLSEGAALDLEALAARLSLVAPGVAIDDHGAWLNRLVNLVRSVQILGGLVLALIVAVTVGTVVFTTRAGLAVHQDVIEVLHLIGAQDSYVARQFALRAALLGLRGGAMGLILGVPAVLAIGYLAGNLETGLLPEGGMGATYWIACLALVPVVAAVAALTSHLTVTRTLGRMV